MDVIENSKLFSNANELKKHLIVNNIIFWKINIKKGEIDEWFNAIKLKVIEKNNNNNQKNLDIWIEGPSSEVNYLLEDKSDENGNDLNTIFLYYCKNIEIKLSFFTY